MNENFDAFDCYVMGYDLNEKMIGFKYNHSYRVVHQCEEIARYLNLDEEDKEIASIVGLLHDTARFKQWRDYKTFNDFESFDHGDEAVKILFDEGLINKFKINKDYYEIIKKAIKYHNKYIVDFDDLSVKEALHTKIIRDADKIDILYSFSTNRLIEIEEDDTPISKEVSEVFFKHGQVKKVDVKTVNESIIMKIGLAFDLYYDYSREKIRDEKYIEKMFEHIKNKELFKPYFDEVINYLKGENNDREEI